MWIMTVVAMGMGREAGALKVNKSEIENREEAISRCNVDLIHVYSAT